MARDFCQIHEHLQRERVGCPACLARADGYDQCRGDIRRKITVLLAQYESTLQNQNLRALLAHQQQAETANPPTAEGFADYLIRQLV